MRVNQRPENRISADDFYDFREARFFANRLALHRRFTSCRVGQRDDVSDRGFTAAIKR